MNRVLIIDGSNLLWRGYHAITSKYKPKKVADPDDPLAEAMGDIPVQVFVTSFLQSLKNYVVRFDANEIYVVWDKRLCRHSTNFRKQSVTVAYKANRDPSIAKKVYASEEMLTPIVQSLGIKVMYPYVLEGDDVIAWLSYKLKDDKITIISVDKDLSQLITSNCILFDPIKDIEITVDNFEAHLLVPKKDYLKYKALLGDSDNIDGIKGYGKKKAAEAAIAWDPAVFDTATLELIESYIKLMDLAHGIEVHPEDVVSYQEQFDQLSTHNTDFKKFAELIVENTLSQINNHLEKWRGVFNKGGTIKGTPINSYLKGLFA